MKPLKFVVSLGLLAVVIAGFGPGNVLDAFISAKPGYLALALAAFLVSGVAGSIQWSILLRFHGIYPGYGITLSRYFMGLFFNYMLPGFVGGDVVRIYQVSKISGKGTRAFSSTLADRVMGLLVLVMFSIGAYLYMPTGPATGALPVALLMFAVLAGFFAIAAFKGAGRLINRLFGRFMPVMFHSRIAAVYCEMHDLTRSPTTLLTVVFTASITSSSAASGYIISARMRWASTCRFSGSRFLSRSWKLWQAYPFRSEASVSAKQWVLPCLAPWESPAPMWWPTPCLPHSPDSRVRCREDSPSC